MKILTGFYVPLLVTISSLLLFEAQVYAQQVKPFYNSFDTPPTPAKTFDQAQEGYIVVNDREGALKVGLINADFDSQMKNDSGDIPFQYWITRSPNVVGLEYSIDTKLKQEGAGSLDIKFKRGDLVYYAGTEVNIFFPPIDARNAEIRFWLRSENDAGKSVYVYLLDEMYRPCEHWGFYNSAIEQWHSIEIVQGKQSDATRHRSNKDYPGDIKRVSGIQITLNGYDEQVSANYHLDGLEITPASRIYFSTVKEIEGECRLRPEADIDGVDARWFDLQLDDTGWGEDSIPSHWEEADIPVTWYRMRFTFSEDEVAALKDKSTYLLFKGISKSAWIWLNGQKLGEHGEARNEEWDQPFAFNITELLNAEGENLLVVKVLNREQSGGIWRPISIVTEQAH